MRRVRGQGGVRDKEEPVTRTCSTSPPDAAKLWLPSFDPGDNTPAGGLRIRPLPARPLNLSPRCRCTSVNAASGVQLPLASVSSFLYHHYSCKSLSLLFFLPSRGIWLFASCFSKSSIKTQPERERKILLWPRNKSL